MSRPPLPPFTARMAEDAWNTRDPARVALAYTSDSRWRNRSEFLEGENRIAVRFAYEWHDDSGERKYHWPLGLRPDDHPLLERSRALGRRCSVHFVHDAVADISRAPRY